MEQPLGLGNVGDITQSRSISGGRLLLRRSRCIELNRCVLGDTESAFENRGSLCDLSVHLLANLVVPCSRAPFIVDFDLLFGVKRKPIESSERNVETEGPVPSVRLFVVSVACAPISELEPNGGVAESLF